MHKTLFLIAAISLLQIHCNSVPVSLEINSSDSTVCSDKIEEKSEEMTSTMMESESSRRVLFTPKRYISYDTLRRDLVPCDRPGASYYNCKSPVVANSYNRGCQIITRCARDG